MQSDPSCIFCKIVEHQAQAAIVYENDGAMAFLDHNQNPEGHMLVVTKKHCRNIFDIDDESGRAAMSAARVVANAVRAALNADGMTVQVRNEHAGGQEVMHFHMHLFPRFAGDGSSSREFKRAGTHELQATAEKIRAHLKDA